MKGISIHRITFREINQHASDNKKNQWNVRKGAV